MNWWLSAGNKTEGPFPAEQVIEWLKSSQIHSDTLACNEGSQEWKKLREIPDFVQHVPPPPPPPPPRSPSVGHTSAVTDSGRSARARFGVLFATIALVGVALFLELLLVGETGEELTLALVMGIGVAIAGVITWAFYHFGLWQLLPEEFRETSPGKAVGFLFIPFFNCYWVFRSFMGVNRGLNRLADAYRIPPPRANTGLATAAAVFFVVDMLFLLLSLGLPTLEGIENQYVIRDQADLVAAYNDVVAEHTAFNFIQLIVSSIPGFILWVLMVLNQKRMVEHLLHNDVQVDPSSSLLSP